MTNLCKKILLNSLDRNLILETINKFLNGGKNYGCLIELYLNEDLLDYQTLYKSFLKCLEKIYKKSFSKKSCAKYLILLEIEQILNKKISYFQGFLNIENIIREYNRYDSTNVYGKNLNKALSEIMHSYDLESNLIYSMYEDENIIIDKINSYYKNSQIDNELKSIYNKIKVNL